MKNFDAFPSDSQESAEEERFPQMSEADVEEMRDQIPILKEMLVERKIELSQLEANPGTNQTRIVDLKTEIEELELEIEGRVE